jgi:hypothetical protein
MEGNDIMTDKTRPDWWPPSPYPESVFVMDEAGFIEAVPDERTRTAICGYLGRLFWGIAESVIFEAWQENGGKDEAKTPR